MDAATGAGLPGNEPGVVVGVDGGRLALNAVGWAVTEARLRGLPLRIMHAAPYAADPVGPGARRAKDILGRAFTVARRAEPEVAVTTGQTRASPIDTLLDAATQARLLVVGMGGGDQPQEVLLGSVALDVSGRASCPVVVVRGPHRPPRDDRPVLVGVDMPGTIPAGENPGGIHAGGIDARGIDAAALTLAFCDARRHGGRLIVLHARHGLGPLRKDLTGADETAEVTVRNHLHEHLAPWFGRFPEVPMELAVTRGNPTHVLLRAAQRARLVVLGSRGHGAYVRALFGSTSREVLRRSPVPVLVVCPNTVVDPDLDAVSTAVSEHRADLDHPHDHSRLW